MLNNNQVKKFKNQIFATIFFFTLLLFKFRLKMLQFFFFFSVRDIISISLHMEKKMVRNALRIKYIKEKCECAHPTNDESTLFGWSMETIKEVFFLYYCNCYEIIFVRLNDFACHLSFYFHATIIVVVIWLQRSCKNHIDDSQSFVI